ncbi:MAG: hypothetical protein LUE12_04425 [Ruminococcus sp.]|nr:hypothetical protein [Ruminococcus sp.]
MQKNVIVLDEFNNQISVTYPKRARGLVKKGRAEYVGDCDEAADELIKIRLIKLHAPTEIFKEEALMSNIINFNAREFKFDETCERRAGQRTFVTDPFGENVESFEIGDMDYTWTQIVRNLKLEKNTEYTFRFAVMETCGGQGGVMRFTLVPRVSATELDEKFAESDWEERYNYSLDKIAPAVKVNTPNGQLGVYEINFNSGDCEIFAFLFIAKQTIINIMPASEIEKYRKLKEPDENASGNCDTSDNEMSLGGVDLSNAVLTMDAYNKAMELASKGIPIDLSGTTVNAI